MPPANPARRRALADAAITLLADQGAHGLTHRSAERLAGMPPGTASNYFRNREALLVAAAERISELHMADMDAATSGGGPAPGTPEGRWGPWSADDLAELLADSLWTAATALRDRYLAVFELQSEARRHPALSEVLTALWDSALAVTRGLHAAMGTPVPQAGVQTLATLYNGALFALVSRPADRLDRAEVGELAAAMVRGAVGPPR
ncbi:TetR/AcrR family transcriptional regulator [Nocardiopsis chromatogenes]|uniref:TetR/AcrR family transcriptional regulator n=1 Tax=Nocardiopsis chromatogenes TaxID=280239 RepID=UPI00034829F2|nr:TetR/AcrR family transcriptional regulator [Nocardiopsis chromatogenes]